MHALKLPQLLSRKRAWLLVALALGVGAYVALPRIAERVARHVLRGQAQAQGLDEFQLARFDLSLNGRFEAGGISLAGTPTAASATVERLEITIPTLSGQVSWKRLLLGETAPTAGDPLPRFLSWVSMESVFIDAQLASGARPRVSGATVHVVRERPGTLNGVLNVADIEDTAHPRYGHAFGSTMVQWDRGSLSINFLILESPRGRLSGDGRIGDLTRFIDAVKAARAAPDLSTAAACFTTPDTWLALRIEPSTAEQSLDSRVFLTPPSTAVLSIAATSAGLALSASADGLILRTTETTLHFPRLPLRADPTGVAVEGAVVQLSPHALRMVVSASAPLSAPLPFQLCVRSASDVDVTPFLPASSPIAATGTTHLELVASGTLQPATLTQATATAALDGFMRPPGMNEALRVLGSLAGTWDGARLRVRTTGLRVGDGLLSGELASWFHAGRLTPPVGHVQMRHFPAAALIAYASPWSAAGVIDACAWTADGQTMHARMQGRLEDLACGGARIGPASFTTALDWKGSALRVTHLRASAAASALSAHGDVQLDPRTLNVAFDGDLSGPLLGVLQGWAPADDLALSQSSRLSLVGSASGAITGPGVAAEFRAEQARYRGVDVHAARGRLYYQAGRVQLRDVSIEGPGGRAHGQLDLRLGPPLAWSLDARVEELQLAPMTSVEGAVSGPLHVRWEGGLSALSAQLSSPRLSAAGQVLSDVSLVARLDNDRVTGHATLKALDGSFDVLASGDLAGPVHLRAHVKGVDSCRLQLAGTWDGEGEATWSAPLRPWPEDALRSWQERLSAHATLRGASVGRGGVAVAALIAWASLEHGRAGVALASASPAVALWAERDLSGHATQLSGDWQNVDLARFIPGCTAALSIISSGALAGAWDDRAGPALEIDGRATRLSLPGWSLRQVDATRLHLSARQLAIEPWAWHDPRFPDARLVLSGRVAWETGEPMLDVSYRVDRVNLAGLRGLSDAVQEVGGVLAGDGRITGPARDPALLGALRVSQGRLRVPGLPGTLYDVELALVGDAHAVQLSRFSGRMGRGTLSASGAITLAGGAPALELALAFTDLRYAETRDLSLEADGALRLAGPLARPTLSGDVRITRGAYTRAFDWTRLVLARLAPKPIAAVEKFTWDPRLDLAVSMPRDFWVRNSIVNAELSGAGRLVGTLASPSFTGKADVLRGAFQLDFARFQFERASAIFEESRPFVPYLLVSGVARESGYVIRAQITGEPGSLELSWSSNPPLSQEQIVSLLSTGSVAGSGAEGKSATAAWLLSQGLRHSAGGAASRALAVESVELRPVRTDTGVASEVVTEEKLTERFSLKQYVGVEDPANTSLGADLALTDHLSLSGRARRNNVYMLEMIYEMLF